MASGTDWTLWRDIAAVWGAALSSLLFLERLFPARPLIGLEPGPFQGTSDPGLTVRIVNPSRDMLLIGNVRRFRVAGAATELGIFTRQTPLTDVAKNPSPVVLYVRGESDAALSINFVGPGAWVLLIWWRRTWLLSLWLPRLVLVSTALAMKINSGAKSSADE